MDLVCGRDFVREATIETAEIRAGDLAPDGSGPLELARGIEIAHMFQLGRWFAEVLDLRVLDEHGKRVVVTIASDGIGVTRPWAAIAESTHEELGLCWRWRWHRPTCTYSQPGRMRRCRRWPIG